MENISSRAKTLLETMTIAEKVGQLNQVLGPFEEHEDVISKGAVGSFILGENELSTATSQTKFATARQLNHFQRLAVEESPSGIPILFGRDVIHGFKTIFPIPLAQAASWNPELSFAASRASAREARQAGVHWTFSPMVDVARDARWGRVAEGYGEDPYLTSKFGVAAVKGYQGNRLSDPDSMLACAKHFAAYGAVQAGRDYNIVDCSERTLREVFFPPFKAALEAGVGTFMSAFNEINGVPASSSTWLFQTVLREQWGFDGFVVSDWESISQLRDHGVAADKRKAAMLGIEAGVDMDMVSESYLEHLEQICQDEPEVTAHLNASVARVLTIKERLGLFDNPYFVEELEKKYWLHTEHKELAREFAAQTAVLLTNKNDLLPLLDRSKRIALCGPMAKSTDDLLGTWVLDADFSAVRSLEEALKQEFDQANFECCGPEVGMSQTILKRADIGIVALGEDAARSGEAASISDIGLPAGQLEYLRALKHCGCPIVALVFAGRPLVLEEVCELADAVLFCLHPGTEAAAAIADLITGKKVPCGQLPVSLPRTTGQVPIYYNSRATGRPAERENKFTSQYLDTTTLPLFPFGFGLSYSTFEMSDINLSSSSLSETTSVTATVEVRNTGEVAARKCIQLYLKDCEASLTRPLKELRNFSLVELAPGEAKSISFQITPEDLEFFMDGEFRKEPGQHEVLIGFDSDTCKEAKFEYC